jgi:hypothetical protein
MKAKDFDKLFDEGKDVTSYLDTDKKVRVVDDVQRVNVDFPRWMVDSLDGEAKRLGISRQAVIKFWIAEKLEDYRA